MTAKIVELADALADALRGHRFSLSFLCERDWDYELPLTAFTLLRVTVLPVTWEPDAGTRDEELRDYRLQVEIQQKLTEGPTRKLQIDGLAALVEEMAAFLLSGLAGVENVLDAKPATLCDRDQLRQYGLYTAALDVTVRDLAAFR